MGLPFGDLLLIGTLAAKYEKLGGEVKWMGKPDKVISSHILFVIIIYQLKESIMYFITLCAWHPDSDTLVLGSMQV